MGGSDFISAEDPQIDMKIFPRLYYKKLKGYHNRKVVLNKHPPFRFAYGRTALKFGIKALRLCKGDQLLIPEYICDVVLHPLNQLGIIPVYYTVNRQLEPEWEDVVGKIGVRTKALLMTHYFGQPQDISKFRDICNKHRLFLIEDNAHGYGGVENDKFLGEFGDIGIASPRKVFHVINGAYLYVKKQYLPEMSIPALPLEPMNIIVKRIKGYLKWKITTSRFLKPLNIRKPCYDSQSTPREHALPDWGMDIETEQFLDSQNIQQFRARRRELYYIWQQWAVKQGLTPVYSKLSDGTSPLSFPAYTSFFGESKKWYDWGYEHGVDVHSWPSLPQEIVNKNGSTMSLWKELICFPICVSIVPDELKRKTDTWNIEK